MGQTREQRIIKQVVGKPTVERVVPIATGMIMPNHSGIATHPEFTKYLSDYVPYTGATKDVDLGSKNFKTTGTIGLNTDPVADYPITALQSVTDKGIKLKYSDRSMDWYYGSGAEAGWNFKGDNTMRFVTTASRNMVFRSGNNLYVDLGDAAGAKHWYVRDSNFLVRLDMDSDGNLKINGTAKIGDGGTTNYTEIKADGEINLHGTARVEKCVTIRVGGFKAPGANPADLEALGIGNTYAFDANVQEYISTEITLPVDMDRSVAPTLVADWSAAATTGTAVWQMEYLYRAPDEDMTAAAQETILGESTPSGTSNGLVREEMTGIDLPSSTDRVMLVRISRDTSDAVYTDDMPGDAHLTAIKLCYTSNKLGTAL